MAIQRHKAAITRTGLSKPVQLLLESGLLRQDVSFFDYGCGQGGDVTRLTNKGYSATGWDPHFTPGQPKCEADVVNLGYVLNVIERAQERAEVLRDAWGLTRDVLVVAVRSFSDLKSEPGRSHGDGFLTSIGTFQKFYDQTELKNWVSSTLDVRPVPWPRASSSFSETIDAVRCSSLIDFVGASPSPQPDGHTPSMTVIRNCSTRFTAHFFGSGGRPPRMNGLVTPSSWRWLKVCAGASRCFGTYTGPII